MRPTPAGVNKLSIETRDGLAAGSQTKDRPFFGVQIHDFKGVMVDDLALLIVFRQLG